LVFFEPEHYERTSFFTLCGRFARLGLGVGGLAAGDVAEPDAVQVGLVVICCYIFNILSNTKGISVSPKSCPMPI
jgi:hypothetical protein